MGRWLLYSLCWSALSSLGLGCPQISAPGFLGVNTSDNATFAWCLGTNEWFVGDIYLNGDRIAVLEFGNLYDIHNEFMNHIHYQATSTLCAGFLLTDVKETFAGAYTVQLSACTLGGATLYIRKKPDIASLSASAPSHEGSQFTLECHATSTSLLATDRPEVNMVYTWRNNSDRLDPDDLPERYSITSSGDPANAVNDLLVISGLSRHDAGSYTCHGHENGSTSLSDISIGYMLLPLYYPGRASPGGDQTVVAGDTVTLSCYADDHGRPGGSWIWTTPGGAMVNTSDVGQLTITEATVENDDGEYSCHLNNHVGDGARGYITVTVFDGPTVLSFDVVTPNGSINQHDEVTILCQTHSRPNPVTTLMGPRGDTLVSSSANNTLEHTLTDVDCQSSGYYKCIAFNAFTGRQRSTLLSLTVQCPPRKYITSDTRVAAAEGETVTFSISVVAFPAPTFTWDKRYEGYFTNTSSAIWCSLHVCLSSSIIIPHITQSDYGNYSVTACNPLGVMEDVVFSLTAAGKPDVPSELKVHHANAVSITMQWTSGWDRGGEQVFTLMYRRSNSDDSYTNITDISDQGQGETVTSKAVGLLPDTSYDFMVRATNQFGLVMSQQMLYFSAAEPRLDNDGSLSVTIHGDKAVIKWPINSYNGPITHVDVNSCDVSSDRCFLTTVLNITSAVEVTVADGGSTYTFVFMVYDGKDLLLNVKHVISIDSGPSTGLVVGVVVAVVLLCAVVVVIGVIVWRRRMIRTSGKDNKGKDPRQRQTRQICDSRPDKNYENDSPHEWEVSISDNTRTQQEQSPYEQIEDSAHSKLSAPSVYERPQAAQSVVVRAVYETLHPDSIDSAPLAGHSDNLELSEYANKA